jgi:nitroreductase
MNSAQVVDDAITSRRSVRGFLNTPVARETVEDILRVASRAPSGTNVQQWKVYVLMGEKKAALSSSVLAAHDENYALQREKKPPKYTTEYQYYPEAWFEPYLGRRRKVGWDLYSLLSIGKTDYDRMHAQHGRNYTFFDAPVGFIFTIDRRMPQGGWIDYGMFLQNIMVAARARGLHTCPQQAFAAYHSVIAETLKLPENEMVVCGMSLGVEDEVRPENALRTERASVDEFAVFV